MITLEQGIELVWHAFEDMVGGEIYVKKIGPGFGGVINDHGIIGCQRFFDYGSHPDRKVTPPNQLLDCGNVAVNTGVAVVMITPVAAWILRF